MKSTIGSNKREGMGFCLIPGENVLLLYGGCNENIKKCYNGMYAIYMDNIQPILERVSLVAEDLPKLEGTTLIYTNKELILFGGCAFNKNCINDVFVFEPEVPRTRILAQLDQVINFNQQYRILNAKIIVIIEESARILYATASKNTPETLVNTLLRKKVAD